MLAGTLFALAWAWIRHIRLGEWARSSSDPMHSWSRIIIVILFGAYLPLWLQQIAFKNTQVGIAQTMLATSPLFILPITALHREKITWKEVLGAVISLTGIAILFLA
jgi:drug/metabolite transporter (DMT)-like permease